MTPERWQKVKQIFSEVADKPEGPERQAYLERACTGDDLVRGEVESMLSAQAVPSGVLGAFRSLPGTMLLHYEVFEKIGEGTMGCVYHARDTHLGRYVALKVLPALIVANPDAKRRFIQEAKLASALIHPNIVTVHDINHDRGLDFIVMEYVAGKTLDRLIPPKGWPLRTCLGYALQIAEALAAAHSAKIIHRDLKPENILLTDTGLIKVVDFGLAKAVTANLEANGAKKTLAGAIVGTASYMSPEQVRAEELDLRSDIFSFGAILFQMLTGRSPFKRNSTVETMNAILSDSPPSLPVRVPRKIQNITMKCLEKDRSVRLPSAARLVAELRASILAQQAVPRRGAGPLSPRVPSPRWYRRMAWGAGAILIIGVGMMMWSQPLHRGPHAADRVADSRVLPSNHSDVRDAAVNTNKPRGSSDSPADSYYRGLASQARANGLCFERRTGDCDIPGALAELKLEIRDFTTVLNRRPHHPGSLWNRGIAYSNLCELQSRTGDGTQAYESGQRAISDLEELARPGPIYKDLTASRPNAANIRWNLALTHLLESQIVTTRPDIRQREATAATQAFDELLHKPGYASFREKRLSDVKRYRELAERLKISVQQELE